MMLTHAILRKPGSNMSQGITTMDLGTPDYTLALQQHAAYADALRAAGLRLTILEADLRYPDCTFVEDTAVLTERCAVITKPGDLARQGEETEIAKLLAKVRLLERIQSPGTVDGGDILRVENHFYIGRSHRTNTEGARQFAAILSKHGYTASEIPVQTVLHLKTGITYIGKNTVLAIDEFKEHHAFRKFTTIAVASEDYAANCLVINDTLLTPTGFPRTKKKLQSLGYNILEVPMSEFQKMEGGLTCLSLLY